MIDWLGAILPVPQRISGGAVLKVSPDGEIETERSIGMCVQGSWSPTVTVANVWAKRAKRGNPVPMTDTIVPTFVYINGNPAKFLQGHNVYGSDNLPQLARLFFRKIAEQLGFDQDVIDLWGHIGLNGRYEITRIDITYNYRVEGGSDSVNSWIRAAHMTSRASHKNSGVLRGNTLYFGKHSRRHTIKIYNKYQDLTVHHPCSLIRELGSRFNDVWDRIHADANGLLRVEQTFRARKLRDMGYDLAGGIDAMKIRKLFNDGMENLQISQQVPDTKICKETVGRGAYAAYLAWKCGEYDAGDFNRMTVYRHRRALLPFGVDILLPLAEENQITTVPLIRVLEAVPVEAPSWYYDFNLIAA